MSIKCYIPPEDADFNAWAIGFVSKVEGNAADYGLSPDEVDHLNTAMASWGNTFAQMFAKRDEASAATAKKDQIRRDFESYLQKMSHRIQLDPNVSPDKKAEAGLPSHPIVPRPATVPETFPMVQIESRNPLQQNLRFVDSASTQRSSRPQGVFAIEIHCFVGEHSPKDAAHYSLHSIVTRMKAVIEFEADDARNHAYYRCRYINRSGQPGPWSMPVQAIITG